LGRSATGTPSRVRREPAMSSRYDPKDNVEAGTDGVDIKVTIVGARPSSCATEARPKQDRFVTTPHRRGDNNPSSRFDPDPDPDRP
jgi:hypothetical protein